MQGHLSIYLTVVRGLCIECARTGLDTCAPNWDLLNGERPVGVHDVGGVDLRCDCWHWCNMWVPFGIYLFLSLLLMRFFF